MPKANIEEMKNLGLQALHFVADTTIEVEILREIAELAIEDNSIYIENRNLLKESDNQTWKRKQSLIKALRKWKEMN